MTPINIRANGPHSTSSKIHFEFNQKKQAFLFTSKPPNLHRELEHSVNTEKNPALRLVLENPKLHYMDPDDPPIPGLPPPCLPCTSSAGGVQDSLQVLATEVHASHLSRQSEYVSGKSTDQKYKNRVREYLEWWENDQALQCEAASKNSASWVTIPAHPITATKVALYLDYVTKRPQVKFLLPSIRTCNLNLSFRKIPREKTFQILG